MRKVHGLSWEIAISSVRKALVPDGYTAYPFRRNTPESFLDMLHSIDATYTFHNKLEKLKQEGADFCHGHSKT
jgi:hypothetical protein